MGVETMCTLSILMYLFPHTDITIALTFASQEITDNSEPTKKYSVNKFLILISNKFQK